MDIDATRKRATQHLRSVQDGHGPSLLLLQMPTHSTSPGQASWQCHPVNGVPAPDLVATTCHHPGNMMLSSPPLAWAVVGSTRNDALALYRADGGKLRHIARVCNCMLKQHPPRCDGRRSLHSVPHTSHLLQIPAKTDGRVTRGLACAVWWVPVKAAKGLNKDVKPVKKRSCHAALRGLHTPV